MYQLKQIPEDFIVKEITKIEPKESGTYTYFLVRKTNTNTFDAVKLIAHKLNLREKQIGFAGSKDKDAITEQVFSAFKIPQSKIDYLNLKNIQVQFLGFGDEPISLGDLKGNSFEITVRNLDNFTINKNKYVPNYFDEQRFSEHNKAIGQFLLQKKFDQAIKLINDRKVKEHLQKYNNDFVGAIKKIPIRMLRMYLNSYQSYLWNETVSQFLRENAQVTQELDYSLGKFVFISNPEEFLEIEAPLIGFDPELQIHPKIRPIIEKIMQKESLEYSDFIIREIPELTLEGENRKLFMGVRELKILKPEEDELNMGMKKIILSFKLNKGSYATIVIKSLILLN